jgi:hypothetical protein
MREDDQLLDLGSNKLLKVNLLAKVVKYNIQRAKMAANLLSENDTFISVNHKNIRCREKVGPINK